MVALIEIAVYHLGIKIVGDFAILKFKIDSAPIFADISYGSGFASECNHGLTNYYFLHSFSIY